MREWSSGMRVEGEIDVYIFMRMFTFLYERMTMDDDDDDGPVGEEAVHFAF
jgi:hypothetical protein